MPTQNEKFGDIHNAEVLRALKLSADSVTDETSLDEIDDMLTALISVVEHKSNFAEFTETTGLANKEVLN